MSHHFSERELQIQRIDAAIRFLKAQHRLLLARIHCNVSNKGMDQVEADWDIVSPNCSALFTSRLDHPLRFQPISNTLHALCATQALQIPEIASIRKLSDFECRLASQPASGQLQIITPQFEDFVVQSGASIKECNNTPVISQPPPALSELPETSDAVSSTTRKSKRSRHA